ncbi:YveK family protein [Listeria booriae]|uniref:Capsule biosynthesis protein CapA n=1 Tax=Listeria booriae TaxID=1552123 RepID=A0A842AKL6_9LIST|nr:Wzz/FepE/Etk N-terminal domain-containing protein [Listeria booriae]MBC1403200.1 capsule biosynthesis protein CapA [Listeria booriae]MBC1616508.1 capsule biosynthesis protein CapA [Listeria booriae]MBC2320721.1 capsule biosynthesis protein CapA [Listeria booriae]
MDIKLIFQTIKRNSRLIIGLAIIGILAAGAVTFFVIPKGYSATTQILVTQAKETDNAQSSEVQANIQMVNTYSVILKSKQLLKEVAKEYPQYTSNDIEKMMMVTSDSNSQVINLKVRNKDPHVAVNIANTVTNQFVDYTSNLIKSNNVSILSKAYIEDSQKPSSPNHNMHLAIGLLVALFLSFVIIVLKEVFDNTIKTQDEIEELLKLPILGTVNQIEKGNK